MTYSGQSRLPDRVSSRTLRHLGTFHPERRGKDGLDAAVPGVGPTLYGRGHPDSSGLGVGTVVCRGNLFRVALHLVELSQWPQSHCDSYCVWNLYQLDCGVLACWLNFCQLDINLDISGEERLPTEDWPPSDWPVDKAVVCFLDG